MDTTFELLGLTLHVYGICAAVAACFMAALTAILCRKRAMPVGTAQLFGVLAIPLGIVCARALYCVFNASAFTETYENPWLMLNFFDGGLSMPGMIGGLLIAAAITARVQKISFAKLMDILCVPMGLAIGILRFGEQFTDLGVGKAVEEGVLTANAPWLFLQSRMGVAVEYRLNVWHYEAICAEILFLVMLWLFFRGKERQPGELALLFFTLYGATQVLWESMRDDGHMLIIFLRIGQLAAALMLLISGGVLTRRHARRFGRAGQTRRVLLWVVNAICVLGVVLLEFSLDGRLTVGTPSLGRDYGLMAALCTVIAVQNGWLLHALGNARETDHAA